MKQNVSQINGGTMIYVDVRVKNNIYVKKIKFGILLLVAMKMEKYLARIMDDSAIVCDEVIKPYDEEIKTIPITFNEKIKLVKHKNIYYHFVTQNKNNSVLVV